MSSMINRLRTLWIGGDDMGKWNLLGQVSVTDDIEYTITLNDSITEILVYTDANSGTFYPITWGLTLDLLIVADDGNRHFHSMLIKECSKVLTQHGYRKDYTNHTPTHFTNKVNNTVGVKASNWGYTIYMYGR